MSLEKLKERLVTDRDRLASSSNAYRYTQLATLLAACTGASIIVCSAFSIVAENTSVRKIENQMLFTYACYSTDANSQIESFKKLYTPIIKDINSANKENDLKNRLEFIQKEQDRKEAVLKKEFEERQHFYSIRLKESKHNISFFRISSSLTVIFLFVSIFSRRRWVLYKKILYCIDVSIDAITISDEKGDDSKLIGNVKDILMYCRSFVTYGALKKEDREKLESKIEEISRGSGSETGGASHDETKMGVAGFLKKIMGFINDLIHRSRKG